MFNFFIKRNMSIQFHLSESNASLPGRQSFTLVLASPATYCRMRVVMARDLDPWGLRQRNTLLIFPKASCTKPALVDAAPDLRSCENHQLDRVDRYPLEHLENPFSHHPRLRNPLITTLVFYFHSTNWTRSVELTGMLPCLSSMLHWEHKAHRLHGMQQETSVSSHLNGI